MFVRIYLLSFVLHFSSSSNKEDLEITSGLDFASADSMALGFYIQINNKGPDSVVECSPDRCCLQIEGEEDCDVLQIIGGCHEAIPEGSTRTVRLAAPLLDPFFRRGYCTVYLDSRPEERGVIRYTVKIDFDTTALAPDLPDGTKSCETVDQDPFDDCKPVDCDTRYNGQKPHYNPRMKRCVEAPPCIAANVKSPDVVYDKISNKCLKNFSLSDDDIDYIQSLSRGKTRNAKDIIIIKNNHNQPVISSTVHDRKGTGIDGESNGTRSLVQSANLTDKLEVEKPSLYCRISDYFETYKDTFIVLAIIVAMQFCLICTMLYLLAKTCQCDKEKPLVSRFFNYRHDISVTTPLIDTSDHDTETTYQYLSDTSTNVDKKIKCYKACHKNRTRSARFSMSDDILAKCLTRRDWKQRSDAIPELKPEEWAQSDDKHSQDRVKRTETKVNFENEVRKSKSDIKPKAFKSIVKRKENIDVEPSSEKEIKCLNYDNCEKNSNHQEKMTISLSSEKSAQACFSNDSIDDFLSERGMIFLAGENISKYTFSSDSTYNMNMKNSCSELSCKTSKNNIVQNVLSLLQRKQHGPASDPGGGQKSTDNLNLELLHMSQASVFSSTNGSECVEGFKRTMDSRTSL